MLQPFFSAMGAGDIFDEIGESRSLGKGVDIGAGLDNGDGVGSTSTTRTTALPSRTFLTLSASKSFLSDDGEDEDEEPPEKASQNAEPSLRTSVCDANEASIACCSDGVGCDCKADGDAVRDAGEAYVRGGEGGGEGYALAAALPERRADKLELDLK